MEVDFIKWLASKQSIYELVGGDDIGNGYRTNLLLIDPITREVLIEADKNFLSFGYPMLLQRAIERLNANDEYDIVCTRSNIVVFPGNKEFEIEPANEDQAKEQVLKYIREREQ